MHVLAAGGKRVRPILVHRFGAMCGADPGRLQHLGLAVELLHTATLVHDDLIDAAAYRRGVGSLHVERGSDVAILVGDLYLARCGVHLSEVAEPVATRELFEALATIVRGELQQRGHRFDLTQVQADYLATIQRKTASLLEAGCAAAVAVSPAPDRVLVAAAREYGRHLGIAFQVVDDVLDYEGDPRVLGKPVGNDIQEGTVTLPLILTLEEVGSPIESLVAEARESSDYEPVRRAVVGSGALPRCAELARHHTRLAVAALDAFPDTPDRAELAAIAGNLAARHA